jgi:Domain of unknown function (DUF1707)
MADPRSNRGGQTDLPAAVAGDGLRASHADRDQVAELLRVAAGDGRLSAQELDDRLERALTARTYTELAALTVDLPATPGAAVQLRIEINGSVHGAGITAGPPPPPGRPRRTFWQWLRRAPRPGAIAA